VACADDGEQVREDIVFANAGSSAAVFRYAVDSWVPPRANDQSLRNSTGRLGPPDRTSDDTTANISRRALVVGDTRCLAALTLRYTSAGKSSIEQCPKRALPSADGFS
jgi:hypothetical protein